MSSSTPTNSTATVVNTVVDGVFNAGATAVTTILKTEVPFLNWPIIGTITSWAVNLICGKLYQYVALCLTFVIIDIQVSSETSDFNKSLAALKAAQAGGNANEIATALANFQKASNALTHWDGGANPGSM